MKKYCSYCGNRSGIKFASQKYIIAGLLIKKAYCSYCGAIKKEAAEFMKRMEMIIRPSRNFGWDIIVKDSESFDPKVRVFSMGKEIETYAEAAKKAKNFSDTFEMQYRGPIDEAHAVNIEKDILIKLLKQPFAESYMRGYGRKRLEDLGVNVATLVTEELK